jgi:hypothetical protein
VIYSIPTRGFTAAVSVFIGTPPAKPLKCKSVSNHLGGALMSDLWADPTGEEFCILCAIFSFVLSDIIETSFFSVHSQFTFRSAIHCSTASFQGNKKPCLHQGKQGGKILFRFFTCLPPDYPKWFRGYARDTRPG